MQEIEELPRKKTRLPIAAGILTIVAACACIITGVIGLIFSAVSGIAQFLIQGVIAVLAFAFGLTSGIMSLKRSYFVITIIGICIITVAGLVNVVMFGVPIGFNYGIAVASILMGLLFGLPVVILSILSIIFVTLSKREFSH